MILGQHTENNSRPRPTAQLLGAPMPDRASADDGQRTGRRVDGGEAATEQYGAGQIADGHMPMGRKALQRHVQTRVDGLYRGPIIWMFCFCSFLSLQLNQSYGTVAAAMFLAPWLLLFVRRIPRLIQSVAKDWLLLIPPSFATISAIWSSDPAWTMRTGIQYGATMIVGIAAARLVDRRVLLTSLLSALAAITFASLVLVARYGGFASLHGVAGLYGAKNQFASSSAVLLIGATYLMIYARRSFFEKMLAFGLMFVAMIGIYCGHSAGTLVSLFAVMMLAVTFHMLRKGGSIAILGVIMMFFAMPVPIILVGSDTIFSRILKLLGKDSTLTGRTDLWDTAFHEIQSHLLLGGGYQAFWRIGNQPAERLWAMFGIDNKTGFNFHNEYINTTVDLGLIGLLIIIVVLVSVAICCLRIRWRQPENLLSAFHTIFFFYLFLTFVEAEFFYQFFLSPIILCVAWSDRALAFLPVVRRVAKPRLQPPDNFAVPVPLVPPPAPPADPAGGPSEGPGRATVQQAGTLSETTREFLLGRRVEAERSM
ncbi:MAG TPA: O-antigen ligase family protein [Dongiaceae bacterium]|nr:O-antigen ligase family protein [Dongiaceae bacterium]